MANKAVREILVADAGVTALVLTRVYPVIAPEDAAYPYIVLSTITDPVNDLRGHSGLDIDTVLLDVFSNEFAGALAVATAARACLQIAGLTLEQANQDYDPTVQLHRHSQQWKQFT